MFNMLDDKEFAQSEEDRIAVYDDTIEYLDEVLCTLDEVIHKLKTGELTIKRREKK